MGKLPNFTYKVVKDLGVISETPYQAKRLRLISYNGTAPKFDLRLWVKNRENPDEEVMGKGVTMNTEEISFLKEILDGMDLDTTGAVG